MSRLRLHPSKPSNQPKSASGPKLPLRWAVILATSSMVGVLVGFVAGAAAGVTTGVALAGLLHTILD